MPVLIATHEIEISPITTSPINDVDEVIEFQFNFKNRSPKNFPGANIGIDVKRSNFPSIQVINSLEIPPLFPEEEKSSSVNERPFVSGVITFEISFPIIENRYIDWVAMTETSFVFFFLMED